MNEEILAQLLRGGQPPGDMGGPQPVEECPQPVRALAAVNPLGRPRKVFVDDERQAFSVYPAADQVFAALKYTPYDKVNVLLSLDPNKLDYDNNPRVHRTDHDFAVAWSKTYGKGRVFYSTLGHTEEAWEDPDIRKMYFEAIRWALGMTDGSTASHPRPASSPAP